MSYVIIFKKQKNYLWNKYEGKQIQNMQINDIFFYTDSQMIQELSYHIAIGH